MIATTCPENSVSEPTLYVAFELGKKEWEAGDDVGVRRGLDGCGPSPMEIGARWKARCETGGGGSGCRVRGAGGELLRSGPRQLLAPPLRQLGVRNLIVDSASIEVNRRQRRAKSDHLDALKLVQMLVRVCYGSVGCGARCVSPRRRRKPPARSVGSGPR